MNLVVDGSGIDHRAVRTPAHCRHGAANLPHLHWSFRAVVAAFPYSDRAIVASGHDELSTRDAANSPVKAVDNSAVRTKLPNAFPRGERDDIEGVVCGRSVDERMDEREVHVEYGGLVQSREKAVVCIRGVGLPQSFRPYGELVVQARHKGNRRTDATVRRACNDILAGRVKATAQNLCLQ